MDIRRGDVFWIEGAGGIGSEQRGTRPALIISNDQANAFSKNVTIVWLTGQSKKPMPTHCQVKASELSTALCESVTTVSKERIREYIRSATVAEMEAVEHCLRIAMDLPEGVPVSTQEPADIFEDMIYACDEMYLTEGNDDIACGIDLALRVIRNRYRKILNQKGA